MTTLSLVAGAIGRAGCNVGMNAATVFVAGTIISQHFYFNRDVAIIVAIDTVFRIGITHVLDAWEIPFLEKGTAGHLLWPCLTLLTQPLSAKIAERFFKTHPEWIKKERFIELFGYIALGWKANMMIKDVLYLTILKKA
jgi:hypothetical protein